MELSLFEEGREVIRKVVQRMRDLVEKKATHVEYRDPVEDKIYDDAFSAVQKAKDALRELEAQGQSSVTRPNRK